MIQRPKQRPRTRITDPVVAQGLKAIARLALEALNADDDESRELREHEIISLTESLLKRVP